MKDVIGNELKLGNYVVTCISGYTGLRVGRVIGFTPQRIRVQYRQHHSLEQEKLCASDQCSLLSEESVVLYVLKKGHII